MKPNLVIHIGGAKCGSSAIQHFLSVSKPELERRGVMVPDERLQLEGPFLGQQIWFFENLREQQPDTAAEVVVRRIRRLKELMDDKGQHTLVVSAENLCNRAGFHEYFADLKNDFEIRVVMYIRRQDDYLMSSWQQWYVKRHPDFWSWAIGALQTKGNWLQDLQPWIDTYGREAVLVRRFERKAFLNENIVDDFVQAVGLDPEGLETNVGDRNYSYSNQTVELAHGIRDLFDGIHDNRPYEMFGRLGGKGVTKKKGEVMLTRAQRKALLDAYREGNERIRDMFFPELGGSPLFEDPGPSPFDQCAGKDPVDEKFAVLTRLIYGCYQEIEKLKGK